MGILRIKIEDHLRENLCQSEYKQGFTKNRRIEDNLLILSYCIEYSFEKKKPLYVISIDIKKAFDSVERGTLIKVLKKYKVDPNIINTIALLYSNDYTTMY